MTEAEWLNADTTWDMLRYLEHTIGKPDRKVRLYACASCRRIWDLLDDTCRNAVEVAEAFADGITDAQELIRAHRSACDLLNEHYPDLSFAPGPDLRMSIAYMFPMGNEKDWKQRVAAHCNEFHPDFDASAFRAAIAFCHRIEAVVDATRTDRIWGVAVTDAHLSGVSDAGNEARWARAGVPDDDPEPYCAIHTTEERRGATILRDIFGNPFRAPPTINPAWLTWHDSLIPQVAQHIYEERKFEDLPILSDALLDAGCTNEEIIQHCRSKEPHCRGCWVVDLLLGKE